MSTPTPIVAPNPPLTYEPSMYYVVTGGCVNPDCIRYNVLYTVSDVYSNTNANPLVCCGKCGQLYILTTATLMDPQPVFS